MTDLPENLNPSKKSTSEKASVLLVDDMPANLLSLRVILEELGQNLVEARSGEEAVQRVKTGEFAVVLLDVLLPGMSGFETAKIIRGQERSRHTPIIFLTAADIERPHIEQGYALGAVDFLVKPFVPVALQAKVRGFVELFEDKQRAKHEAEQLRLLIHGTTEYAIFMLDPQGRVITWNAGAERLKGYRAEEIISQHFSRFYPQEAIDRGWPAHELRVATVEGRFEDEGWRVRKDGSVFWANVIITALKDEHGNLQGFSKITRDMTERKRGEENARRLVEETTARRVAEENSRLIQEQRERLHVTLASIGDAVISTDAEGRVDFLNPVAQELVGWKNDEAARRFLSDVFRIVNQETRQPVESPSMRALQEGVVVGLANHTVLISKDGTERPIDDSAAPIRDASGNVIGCVLVFRDITERKRSEQRLREQQEWLRVTLGSIGDAVIATDTEGRVTFLNRVAQQLTGCFQEQAQGQPLETVFPILNEQTRQQVENPVKKVLRDGAIVGLGNHTILIARDGTERPIDDSAAPIRDGTGKLIGVVLTFRDVTEHRRAEAALRRSEAEARRLLEFHEAVMANMGEGLYAVDMQGQVTYMNPAAERLFGWKSSELLGRKMHDMTHYKHPDGRPFPIEQCAGFRVLREGKTLRDFDDVFIRKDGTFFPVNYSASPLVTEGKVSGLIVVFRDMTERNRAEAGLRAAELRFQAVFNQQFQFMAILAPDGTVVEANETCFTATGVERGQVIGRLFWQTPWWNRLPDMQSKWQRMIGEAVNGSGPSNDEVQYALSDGTIRLATAVVSGLKDDAGRVVNIIVEGRDITERRQQEMALRESEEKLRLLANTIPQLAWMARPDGHVFWYNRRWYEYTGTKPEQMEGWGWQSVHDPDTLPAVLKQWQRSIASGEPFDMVFPLRGGDGQYRPFLTRVNPLKDEQGRILYWFGTNTDISDIKRMEEELRKADRRKDEFLATLAHELRNPLAPIRNSLQILKMPRVDAASAQQTRDMMERQVHHLVRLVDDLLDVSRVMRGKIELRKEPVELATVIARAVETAKPLIEVQGHKLDLSVSGDTLLLDADPVRLAQVIGNLLTNAAKYTEANGHIWLTARREGEQAVLTVRDNGIGIAPDMLPHVFELFVQADHATTKAHGGLGIGLTLVKNLVELHGGTVKASSPGLEKGSEFTIHLPLMTERSRQPGDESGVEPNLATPTSGHRLLVVDDNHDAATSLSMLLRLQGHEVQVAHDGPTALEVARVFRPDLIFLDLGMPGMDGYEVARRLRKIPGLEKTVLAALTGWGQQEDRRRTAQAGFDHHLVKPPEPKALESLLASLPQDQ